MSATAIIFATFGAYMLLLLGIGWWADRRFGASYEGFVSADRSLGAWVAAISSAASSESGWVMLGLSGLGYKHGLGAYWAAFGCAFGFWFNSLFVVRQLRRSSARYDVQTLGDYIADRLQLGGKSIRALSSLLIAFFMLVYVVAQFTSAGKQMVGMQLLDYRQGVLLGALIIGIYVVIGGYAAVCWTDLIQGLLMLAVLVVFPLYATLAAGGVGTVLETLRAQGTASIWVGGEGATTAAIGFALTYFGFALGYPGMPHAIIRYITLRDEKQAKNAAVITAVYGTFVLFGSATLGIVGRAVVSPAALGNDPEKILPVFTATYFPPVLGGVILAAVSAAIMSTADSQLMMAATALVHDVWNMMRRGTKAASQTMVRQTRMLIALLTCGALGIALLQARVIDTLVLFAWGCLGAAFSPVIVLCIYWKRFAWQGAVASFIVGPTFIVIWEVTGMSQNLHGLIPGTGLSVAAAVIASLLGTPPEPLSDAEPAAETGSRV